MPHVLPRRLVPGHAPAIGLVLLAVLACDSPTRPRVAARIEGVSGDLQTAVVATQLPELLVIRVVDTQGRPVAGEAVEFRVADGNGSVGTGTALTGADGLAQEQWTLGTLAGDTQRVEARSGRAGVAPVVFRAVGTPDAPARVEAVAPATRTGSLGLPLADSLAARVKDRYGNPVPRAAVAWAVRRGGGTLSPAVDSTDATGVAKAAWTLGLARDSAQLAQAAAAGAAPAAFSATLATPLRLLRVSGDGQLATLGAPLPAPLVVRLVDALGNGVPADSVVIDDSWVGTATDGMAAFTPTQTRNIQRYDAWKAGVDSVSFVASTRPGIRMSVLARVHGTVMDARHGRVLYEAPGGSLRLLDVADDSDRVVADAGRGWITPSGVVLDVGGTLYTRVGSTVTAVGPASDVQVAGDWLRFRGAAGLTVRNVGSGAARSLPLPAGYTADRAALAPTGELYYSEAGALKVFSGGTAGTLLLDGADRRGLIADSGSVTYLGSAPPSGIWVLARWSGSGEEGFGRAFSGESSLPLDDFGFYNGLGGYRGQEYAAAGEWAAWQERRNDFAEVFFEVVVRRADGSGNQYDGHLYGLLPIGMGADGAVGAGGVYLSSPLMMLFTPNQSIGLPVSGSVLNPIPRVRRPFVFERAGRVLYLIAGIVYQVDY